METEVYSVREINETLRLALQARFPRPVWVCGEIKGCRIRPNPNEHIYLSLVDRDEAVWQSSDILAEIRVNIWRSVRRKIFDRIRESSVSFELQDGVRVKFLVKPDFYVKGGSVSLTVLDIDPSYTLGQLAANKERILKELAGMGLLHRNEQTPLVPVPLDIGLITSEGSAAWHDFLEELKRWGFRFTVRFVPARMQGKETEREVCAAISTLSQEGVDVIAIVRGGGSRSDLSWFDNLAIGKAIALCPIPVITGIGHEIDESVADVVAWRSFKTPTATAQFLGERVAAFLMEFDQAWQRITQGTIQRLERERQNLSLCRQRLLRGAREKIMRRRSALSEAIRMVPTRSMRLVHRSRSRLDEVRGRIRASIRLRLAEAVRRIELAPLLRATRRHLERAWGSLEMAEERIRGRDPARILARGYALLERAAGGVITSVRQLSPAQHVRVRLTDGAFTAAVEEIEPEAEAPAQVNGMRRSPAPNGDES
ncbi:MAG: exodeoxyribonuclease VII large subunit [Deltaproteobacteria bacterium]|nr:MAG: exodeoxyribonuclease VII large subunit [Deltaproteobacteria bacterium]